MKLIPVRTLISLWRHGDPDGIAATAARVERAEDVTAELARHRRENHLGEAFQVMFSPNRYPHQPEPGRHSPR